MCKIFMRNPLFNDVEEWSFCTREAYDCEKRAKECNLKSKDEEDGFWEKMRNIWLELAIKWRNLAAQYIGFKSFKKQMDYQKKYGMLIIDGHGIPYMERD